MERTKLMFLLFIGIFLAIGATFLVLYHFKDRIFSTKSDEKTRYQFPDILDAACLLGKTVRETGVKESYFTQKVGYPVLEFEGALCGKAATGSAFFSHEGENGTQITDKVYIHCYEIGFDACREALSEIYGAPVREWEEPFARANGGAVQGAAFETASLCIHLSRASEREYTELELSKKVI